MKRSMLCVAMALCSCAAFAADDVAMTNDALAQYAHDALVRNYKPDAPGAAILVARGDQVLFRDARGEADTQGHVPLRPDSVFRIGSVTKQFAAAGVLKLVEAGKVKLDDPLSKYVPGFPNAEHITVQELLNHTAGVKNYTDIEGYMDGPVRVDRTTVQMIDAFEHLPADFAPGEGWKYSNSGYVLVGAVIEAASGKPWHAYLDEALFQPLGMKHTGYALDPKLRSRVVHGYTYDNDKLAEAHPISMTQPHAAGSLVSTVDDLFKWNRALHEGRVLRDAEYRRMSVPEGAATERGYGYGLFTDAWRDHPVLRHGGGIFGFISSLAYVPGDDITVVVLENDDTRTNAPETADDLARKLAAVALGNPYPIAQTAAATQQASHADMERYVGKYGAPDGMVLAIALEGDVLQAQLPGQPAFALSPVSATRFDVGDTGAELEFATGDGPAANVTMKQRGRAMTLPRLN